MTDDTPHEFVRWMNAIEGRLYRLESKQEMFLEKMARVNNMIANLAEALNIEFVQVNDQSQKKTNGDHKPPPDDDPSPIVA